jgi:glutathione-regulated potassium-efflux system protein KefB
MALTPLVVFIVHKYFPSCNKESLQDLEVADGLTGSILMIGFGRFGQIISQLLLAKNVDVTIIDSDAEIIRTVKRFGFKVYYGDGSRLDVLRASGAATARAILVCTDKKETTSKIVELIKSEFPQAKLLARSFDRTHARELVTAGVDFQIRETFESAMEFGCAALREMDLSEADINEVAAKIRQLDLERFRMELASGDTEASRALFLGNLTKPAPLLEPQRESQILHPPPENSSANDSSSAPPPL